jgi:hypothetical protein
MIRRLLRTDVRAIAARVLAGIGEGFYLVAERLDPESTPRGKAFADFLYRSYHAHASREERPS